MSDENEVLSVLASLLCIGETIFAVVGAFFFTRSQNKKNKSAQALISEIKRPNDLLLRFVPQGSLKLEKISANGRKVQLSKQHIIIHATETTLALYWFEDGAFSEANAIFIPRDEVRWFGRPEKYHKSQNNKLWIHVEYDAKPEKYSKWEIIEISTSLEMMYRIVGMMKAFTPHLETPYRRHRPYIHVDPVPAQFAEQDIHGAWTLLDQTSLYLMPLYLVLLDGERVTQKIALDKIKQVSAVKRMDDDGGVVRFRKRLEGVQEDIQYAFALENYVSFGESLGEAAKRSLEMPLEIISRKKKKSDDYDDYEDE